jgi:hypothetical protein
MMWWTIGHWGLATGGWELAPGFVVIGIGSGSVFAPLFDIILAALGDHEVGTGSGLLNAVQQFCGALGVAVLGTLFFHWLPAHGFVDAIRWLVLVGTGCYAVSFAVVFLLPRSAREGAPVG